MKNVCIDFIQEYNGYYINDDLCVYVKNDSLNRLVITKVKEVLFKGRDIIITYNKNQKVSVPNYEFGVIKSIAIN